MIELISDHSFWIYIVNIFLALMGFSIFVWWWRKSGSATSIFTFVTLWLCGHLFSTSVEFYSRIMLLIHPAPYVRENILTSWWWPYRYYVETSAIAMLVYTAWWRTLFGRKHSHEKCPCKGCAFRDKCEKYLVLMNGKCKEKNDKC